MMILSSAHHSYYYTGLLSLLLTEQRVLARIFETQQPADEADEELLVTDDVDNNLFANAGLTSAISASKVTFSLQDIGRLVVAANTGGNGNDYVDDANDSDNLLVLSRESYQWTSGDGLIRESAIVPCLLMAILVLSAVVITALVTSDDGGVDPYYRKQKDIYHSNRSRSPECDYLDDEHHHHHQDFSLPVTDRSTTATLRHVEDGPLSKRFDLPVRIPLPCQRRVYILETIEEQPTDIENIPPTTIYNSNKRR